MEYFTGFFEQSIKNDDTEILTIISTHKSDLIRCWATYTIGKNPKLNIKEMLELVGMEFLDVFEAYTDEKPGPKSERILFLAREKGK